LIGENAVHARKEPGIVIERCSLKTDARGWVYEPLDAEELSSQRNVHIVWSAPGCIRGNHYHLEGTEVFLITGPALFRYRERGAVHDRLIQAGEVYRVTIPPLVSHAMQNTGDQPSVMVAFNTQVHDPGNPDTRRDILIP
jgi:dTDP-4-dehydrorhamnose 3,5-epimerase-like enzyme